eukprot:6465150-Amphidinium_carterae.2
MSPKRKGTSPAMARPKAYTSSSANKRSQDAAGVAVVVVVAVDCNGYDPIVLAAAGGCVSAHRSSAETRFSWAACAHGGTPSH